MKTRVQNNLVGSAAHRTVSSSGGPSSSGSGYGSGSQTSSPSIKSALDTAAKSVSRVSKWKGIEMIILRSSIQNMIQMCFFEQGKVVIDNLTFSDGSRTLPEVERHFGRDSRINKNDKL